MEKQRLQAHWDAEAKLSAQRSAARAAKEADRQRILNETQAAMKKAEDTLAGMAAAPAPEPKSPPKTTPPDAKKEEPPKKTDGGLWSRLGGAFKE
jgi:hypothetical protein